jgi:hypothetical protein
MPKKIAALLFVCLCFLPLQARGGDDLAKLGKARVAAAAKAYIWAGPDLAARKVSSATLSSYDLPGFARALSGPGH